jgi:hypothetical protein
MARPENTSVKYMDYRERGRGSLLGKTEMDHGRYGP